MLDVEICEQARLSHDADFDGQFFTAVKTTGIYCRPVCTARTALAKNVVYYPSAAACEDAGFRPCLRCRPESAPFSPAWNGTKTSVTRALTMIDEGGLDHISVEEFAAKLGMSARHLNRLFIQYLGSSPTRVAQTRRVQKAKKLLSDTDMSMTEIAFSAGFSSLRRFNTVFKESYKMPPTAIRRKMQTHSDT
ncbi:MAG TPA: methylphosphotriester-DNA--protein-cysteine methyltransferase family protein [Hellea balneolensis]|uniref:Methylphosphotriester-DNA--protein-cysteine methyltransferase family protein n=1 Tax=Hellea balneolensis TaxID=287478 RepID=A0A7C3CC85_9PROT|nr:methylphosphotriester-DNA--protein-cysteine methyltransferase family protein [Hellea balneolensis]